MAVYNGENFQKAYVTKPSEAIQMGEVAGKKRILMEKRISDVAFGAGDEILGAYIPAGSIVTGAMVKVDKSLGATGAVSLGYKANGVDAEDDNAFVLAAVCTAAELQYAEAGAAGIFKRFEKDTQVFLKFSAALDGSVLDGVITFVVEYVNA